MELFHLNLEMKASMGFLTMEIHDGVEQLEKERICGGQSEQVLLSCKFFFPPSFVDLGLDVWV
jgi:hypothetical protein